MNDLDMDRMVNDLDAIIKQYPHCAAHELAGVLLSRVTLLMTMQPDIGKHLLEYVWQQLDEIEQANPSSLL
jgi:hypothetical protein